MDVAVAVERVVGMGVSVDGELVGDAIVGEAGEMVGVDVGEIMVVGCIVVGIVEAVALGTTATVEVTIDVVGKHETIPLQRLKMIMSQRILSKCSFVLIAIPSPT